MLYELDHQWVYTYKKQVTKEGRMLEVNPAMPAPNHAALSSVNNLFAAALQTTVKHNNVRGEEYYMNVYRHRGQPCKHEAG